MVYYWRNVHAHRKKEELMAELITPEVFNHLVQLAALELSPGESNYLREQLNNQLKAIHELETIPLEGITEINLHGVTYTTETTPAVRSDDWRQNNHSDKILEQAPQVEDRFIVVPEIPHEELE
jgi:aspartyl-tRNA(Asn)/glutamyl-tRNA(Gln) amidotransferase subunit C